MSHVLFTIGNPVLTGAPAMAIEYSRALIEAGHVVTVLGGSPDDSAAHAQTALDRLAELGCTIHTSGPFTATRIPWRIRDTCRVIAEVRPDVVVGMQLVDRTTAVLAAKIKGVPSIAVAGQVVEFRGWGKRWVRPRLYGFVLRHYATSVICVANTIREQSANVFRIPKRKLEVLYNGVDVAGLVARARTSQVDLTAHGVPPGGRCLLAVGRISAEKGHDILLHALAALGERAPMWHLLIAGEAMGGRGARWLAQLSDLIDSLGLREHVTFLGWRGDVPELLGVVDYCVHPSRREGWPLVVMEAFAAGVPVIMSDCSGRPPGFRDGEHGWVVAAGDTDALIAALHDALTVTPERMREHRAAVRVLAQQYDIQAVRERFVSILESAKVSSGA